MRKLVLAATLAGAMFCAQAQEEYYLSQSMTVGCYGANALTDMAKKAQVDIKEDKATFSIKSMACKKDFDMSAVTQLKGEGIRQSFYDQKSKVGMLVTADAYLVIFKKDGSSYKVLNTAHQDKKAAKELSQKDADSKYGSTLKGLDDALASEKKAAEEKAKKEAEERESAQQKANLEKMMSQMGDMYNNNKGKLMFTEKDIKKNDAKSDQPSDFITEFELGNSSMYVRAYYDPENSPMNKSIDIRYSIGNVSVSSEQLRNEMGKERNDRYSGGVATAAYFSTNMLAAFPMVSADKKYYGPTYSMAEDAFRVLLSRVKDKLVKGSTHTVKVELILNENDYNPNATPFMSGEVKMKITNKSENLLSLLCRCDAVAKKDAVIEKQIKDLLLSDPTINQVHTVQLLGRDYKIETSYGKPTARTMEAQALVTFKTGIIMTWKGSVQFPYDGSNYSNVATWHKTRVFLPVGPTCLRGIK